MNPDKAPPGLLFVLLNCPALDGPKLASLLYWLRELHVHGAVIVETHAAVDPADMLQREPGAGTIWPGVRFFYTPGNGHTLGVTIILGPGADITNPVAYTAISGEGRALRVDLDIMGQPASLVGVYAPARQERRPLFYRDFLPQFLPTDGRALLLAGDWNCVSAPEDCVYGGAIPVVSSRLVGSKQLMGIMQQHNLCDPWRAANPGRRDFTHWSGSASSGGRLDRWLVSAAFSASCSASSDILPAPGVNTDHLPVILRLHFPREAAPRGCGLRGFPLRLLNVPTAARQLEAFIHAKAQEVLAAADSDIVALWLSVKESIRIFSLRVYMSHRKERQRAAREADTAALAAKGRLAGPQLAGDPLGLVHEWQSAVGRATAAWQALAAVSLGAAAVLDHLAADTSSYYFHAQAKAAHTPNTIRVLHKPGRPAGSDPMPAVLQDHVGMGQGLQYASDYYSGDSICGRFRDRPVDTAAQEQLLGTLQRRLPGDMAALAEGLDGDGLLSSEEFDLALAHARRGSVPGVDGLPYEFYRHYQTIMVPVLLRVFNAAYQSWNDSAPLAALLLGVICLLHKPHQSEEELVGYRPITLLNCDVKLVMIILSNRMQRPLEYLIDITQSAFLEGRDITDNVRYHLGLAARLTELGLPAWLLPSDLNMAYDDVARSYLTRTQLAMGFKQQGLVRWSQITKAGSRGMVRVNGFFTAPFPIVKGLPQGSSASCPDWAVALQPLMSYLTSLQAQGRLSSFLLPSGGRAPAALAYADDTKTVVLKPDEEGAPVVRAAFETGHRAGLPSQSAPKSVLIRLNTESPVPPSLDPAAHSVHQPTGYRLLQPGDFHRLLGVPYSEDQQACQQEAYTAMPGRMRAAATRWQPLRLNLLGRAHVAMQCVAAKAVYQFSATAPAAAQLADMQEAINGFVAASGRAEEEAPFPTHLYPGAAISFLPRQAGGLGMVDLAAAEAAMKAKPAWLAFVYTKHPWADLFLHEVGQAGPSLPGLPPGPHWIVTCPSAPGDSAINLETIRTPMFRAAVKAFLKLGVQRVRVPEDQSFHSIMLEHTFGNNVMFAAPGSGTPGLAHDSVTSPAARSWLTLGQVREAHLQRADLTQQEAADLDAVMRRLPLPWEAAVRTQQAPGAEWQAVTAVGVEPAIFQGPDPQTGQIGHWECWQLSRMHKYSGAHVPPPSAQPRPALVELRPKPKTAWLRADYDFDKEQALLPPGDRKVLMEPWLVGTWDSLLLDPREWGLKHNGGGFTDLLHMTVRVACTQFRHLNIQSRQDVPTGYAEERAAWPLLWNASSGAAAARAAPHGHVGDEQLRQLGIEGLEERWRRSVAARAAPTDSPADIDRVPQWLDLAQPRPPRPSPVERQAVRGVVPAPPLLRRGFSTVWKRLEDKTMHRPFRITCWRLLHGCLGCNAFLAHVRGERAPDDAALCGVPACSAAGTMETLTHVFLECPEVRPAVAWLRGTWKALFASAQPPRDLPDAGGGPPPEAGGPPAAAVAEATAAEATAAEAAAAGAQAAAAGIATLANDGGRPGPAPPPRAPSLRAGSGFSEGNLFFAWQAPPARWSVHGGSLADNVSSGGGGSSPPAPARPAQA